MGAKHNHEHVLKTIELLGLFNWNLAVSVITLLDLENPKTRIQRPLVTLDDGSIYQGEWDEKTNLKDGKGIQIWPDGSRYDGLWVDDQAEGYGRLISVSSQVVYEGYWKGDKKQGTGLEIH